MRSKKTYRKILIPLVVLMTLLSYVSLRIPPHIFWPAAFLSYGIPFFVFLNLVLFLLALKQRSLTAFIWLLLFAIGSPSLLRTIRFNSTHDLKGTTRVLSVNVSLFFNKKKHEQFSNELIEWILKDSSSVKCIQEFVTNPKVAKTDITGRLGRLGYHGYVYQAFTGKQDQIPGIAIFTRGAIINSGVVWQDSKTINAAIFADIKLNNKVIRIYNIHLSSMNFRARPTDIYGKLSYVFNRLKNGSIKRSKQLHAIFNHMKTSPYPFLVCGDFNETPYSYVYSRMRRELTNAFEERGNGFGFTLNQKPYFLRIDHQFFSKGIKLQKYSVDRTMTISDHFPTYGYYLLP
ncbi:MAG: hypothetical protein DYG99_03820 [Bacteroidetes bacterium CHB5]|nr:hypothetical protein [Bacteroidetes bacterium CHB5]